MEEEVEQTKDYEASESLVDLPVLNEQAEETTAGECSRHKCH